MTFSLDAIGSIETVGQIRAYERAVEAVESFDNYANIKELFKHFFRCSALNMLDRFDFDRAFEVTVPYIEKKLDDHGARSFKEFWNYLTDEERARCRKSKSRLADVIGSYRKFHSLYTNYYQFWLLKDILSDCNKAKRSGNICDCTIVFDAIVHAEHVGGYIFEYALLPDDPNSLRYKVNKELQLKYEVT